MATKKKIEINGSSKFMVNPRITLQEEPDRWGLLYDPHIDFSLGINPGSVVLWKLLETKTTVKEIAAGIRKKFAHVPVGIEKEIISFVKGLLKIGFVTEIPGK